MKVFKQGTLADGSPYVHLGYVAATVTRADNRFMNGGLLLITAGAIVWLTLVVRRVLPGSSKDGVVPRRGRWWIAGLVMLVAGIGGVAMAFQRAREVVPFPEQFTMSHASAIKGTIEELAKQGKAIPGDLASLRPLLPRDTSVTDGWWHEMRLSRELVVDDLVVYRVVSAGPDGLFDTGDDLRFEAPVSKPPKE